MGNLGKYRQMPKAIEALKKLDKELQKEGYSLDGELSLILESDFQPYAATPCDVIPFASIGCDGIHFGLLTDFGTVADLEDAYIVCVSPMDFGSEIKLVARNLNEFVSLVCTMKEAGAICNFNYMKEESEYMDLLKQLEQEEDENQEYTERAKMVVEKIKATIGCGEIEHLYEYIERKIAVNREKQIVVPTLDGLGITPCGNHHLHFPVYTLAEEMDVNLNDVKAFFHTAPTENKLAFIRDAQFTHLLTNESELTDFVLEEMTKLGLYDERERLRRSWISHISEEYSSNATLFLE